MGGSAGPAKKGSSEQTSEAQKQATDQKWETAKPGEPGEAGGKV